MFPLIIEQCFKINLLNRIQPISKDTIHNVTTRLCYDWLGNFRKFDDEIKVWSPRIGNIVFNFFFNIHLIYKITKNIFFATFRISRLMNRLSLLDFIKNWNEFQEILGEQNRNDIKKFHINSFRELIKDWDWNWYELINLCK